jgi:cell division protein ZapA (FtsZ GTPase activity inhibitor)
MKINIQIEDAKPEQLVTIAKALGVKMRNLGGKSR